jgi:hypothetical protein
MPDLAAADGARLIEVGPATLRRRVRSGVVPLEHGNGAPSGIAQARIIAAQAEERRRAGG